MIVRRQSKLRTEILALLQRHHLLSAAGILDLITSERNINKTSVYRALEILSSLGLVGRRSFAGKETLFELTTQHHDHFVCLNCGAVEKIDCSIALPKSVKGQAIHSHELVLYGFCNVCEPIN